MSKRVCVTGGAGFVGSHLVDALVAAGHEVTVVDSLEQQVHGKGAKVGRKRKGVTFDYAEAIYDFPDIDCQTRYLASRISSEQYDVVFHLAARVGVGQAQLEIESYVDANVFQTAGMLDFWAKNPKYRPGRYIVASSMSVYGGLPEGVAAREDLPIVTPNIYAFTKHAQERMSLLFGEAYGVPTCALRFFNVIGERQSLSNPYTGVAAMFAARLLKGKGGLIYENGLQTRDFVHVSDIVQGLMLAMEAPVEAIDGEVFNIGTGKATSLLTLHKLLADSLASCGMPPVMAGVSRKGDVRHCVASIEKAKRVLGYEPKMWLPEAIYKYSRWLATQDVSLIDERVEKALEELRANGLVVE